MQPRISIISLAVRDLERAVRFYRDGLGLPCEAFEPGADHVLFELEGGLSLVLFPRETIALLAGSDPALISPAELILSYPAASPMEVDAVLEQAKAAGALIRDAGTAELWGYTGAFLDPDGHLWEVVWMGGNQTEWADAAPEPD